MTHVRELTAYRSPESSDPAQHANGAAPVNVEAANRLHFLTIDELAALPKPSPIIEGMLFRNALAAIVAPYECFKTFIALSLALCIATGLDWFGRHVTRGAVAYIAAEAPFGLWARCNAWRVLNNLPDVGGIYFLPQVVTLNDGPDFALLCRAIAELPEKPVAIIVDTFARTFAGNENASEDVGRYLRACDRLREATGAVVLLVHHFGWSAERSRGSSALPAALDTEITLRRDGDQVTISCTKQKDAAPFPPITLEAVPMAESLAFLPVVPLSTKLTQNERLSLTVVQNSAGLTSTTWMDATDLAKGSFHNARKRLLALAYVRLTNGKYHATDAGRLALGTTVNEGTTEVQQGGSTEVQRNLNSRELSVVPEREFSGERGLAI